MGRLTRSLLLGGAALLAAACTRVVGGTAVPGFAMGARGVQGVNVDEILLNQSRMRAITGGGDDLTIIPSMDGNRPVDIDALADNTPQPCRFIYRRDRDLRTRCRRVPQDHLPGSARRRPDIRGRRGLPRCGHRSARLRRPGGHRRRLCGQLRPASCIVGDWKADADSLHMRPGGCGRDYRVLSVALLEVTFCGFPQSVSDIVMTNIAANMPG